MDQGEHTRAVKEIFATITPRYDFLNRLLSLRMDVGWRRATCRRMAFGRTMRLLDLATGTADLALDAARSHPGTTVVGLDLVREMMLPARGKIAAANLEGRVQLVQGDATRLPFPDAAFDAVSISFGLRNIPDRPAALREMARVVVPGGVVLVLEMSAPLRQPVRALHRIYLTAVLPRIAGLLSPNPAAYRYLSDSILSFPSPPELGRLMEEAGLERVGWESFSLGSTWLHWGCRPPPC
jgi:demethylmenaquinone methyltransferase/2-methoxy-6-polyprenyl-1,4-benzoquinol methylase